MSMPKLKTNPIVSSNLGMGVSLNINHLGKVNLFGTAQPGLLMIALNNNTQ